MQTVKLFLCRPYKSADLDVILSLFHDTIRSVNIKDYSQEQIDVWAAAILNKDKWAKSLLEHYTYVVEFEDKIVGFGDMTQEGSLEHLYVDKDFQGCSIASLILKAIEQKAHELDLTEIITESSITAKPFFEKRGFMAIREQQKITRGMSFLTYIMKKAISVQ
jgi:putative acetyltransferase